MSKILVYIPPKSYYYKGEYIFTSLHEYNQLGVPVNKKAIFLNHAVVLFLEQHGDLNHFIAVKNIQLSVKQSVKQLLFKLLCYNLMKIKM